MKECLSNDEIAIMLDKARSLAKEMLLFMEIEVTKFQPKNKIQLKHDTLINMAMSCAFAFMITGQWINATRTDDFEGFKKHMLSGIDICLQSIDMKGINEMREEEKKKFINDLH
ncbi:MAG TPA: hypothetical protein VK543_02755 [Puia sp.]|nr:hypothetical protein [Puia sp.]